jgi:hypothetical protein
MPQAKDTRTGGCHCGAVRFQVHGQPKWTAHCHCESCRRSTGAAFATWAGFPTDNFVLLKGKPKGFASSQGVTRGFCGACGTPLTYEGTRWPGEIHALVCTFDDPGSFAPGAHVNTAEKVAWLHIGDELPRFERLPSAKKSEP